MTVRQWLLATWAEWAPSWSRGRFEVGDLVIMSRAELGRTAREHREIGIWFERQHPGEERIHEDEDADDNRSTSAEVIDMRTGLRRVPSAPKRSWMRRVERVAEFVHERGGHRLGDLPIVLVWRKRMEERELAAFELGRDCQRYLTR